MQELARDIDGQRSSDAKEVKQLLDRLGGLDQEAFDALRIKEVLGEADMETAFTTNMLGATEARPQYGGAVSALLYSKDPNVLDMTENILEIQANRVKELRSWQLKREDNAGNAR